MVQRRAGRVLQQLQHERRQQNRVGEAHQRSCLLLRDSKMLPLPLLFQVDPKSPYYNERDKQSIFYAQSWALMHYLIHRPGGSG